MVKGWWFRGRRSDEAMLEHRRGGATLPWAARTNQGPSTAKDHALGTYHGREWLSMAVTMGLARRLRRLVPALLQLDTEVAADAWAPGRPMGALTGGYLLREHNGWSESWKAARPALLVSLWRPDDTGELLADALGSVQPFERLREGVRFDGWVLRQWPGSDRKPMCVPCEVEVFNKRAQGAVRLGPGKCGDCLDLCDPSRLPHAGFELVREPASGPPSDCYWVPREEGAWLEVPLSPDPWGPEGTSRYCTLQFSTYWAKSRERPDWRIVRYEPDGSERVLRTVPAEPPLFPIPPEADRLRNHVFEANASLPDSAQGFRIEVTSIPSGAAEPMRIYEPVVSCWRQ